MLVCVGSNGLRVGGLVCLRAGGLVGLSVARCSGAASATAEVPFNVRVQRTIEEKRKQAHLGGGQKRIDAQHKKVFLHLFPYFASIFKILCSCNHGKFLLFRQDL